MRWRTASSCCHSSPPAHYRARALFEAQTIVHSAHIATYGERAVDTFYVTDLLGHKIESEARLKAVEQGLLDAAGEAVPEMAV